MYGLGSRIQKDIKQWPEVPGILRAAGAAAAGNTGCSPARLAVALDHVAQELDIDLAVQAGEHGYPTAGGVGGYRRLVGERLKGGCAALL